MEPENMRESDILNETEYSNKIEVVFTPDQDTPFAAKRSGEGWQLAVNRTHFIVRGFTPNEIDGAIALEEVRLGKQTHTDSIAEIDGLSKWQGLSSSDIQAATFKTAFERLSALSALEKQGSPRAESARKYLEKFAHRIPGDSNSEQLFSAILRKGLGEEPGVQSDLVQRVVFNLSKQEEVEGRQVSPLEALTSSDLSFDTKAGWFEARFLPRYDFLKNKDQQQQEQDNETSQEQSLPQEDSETPTPEPSSDENEQHRGKEEKGKGQPIFVVTPGFTGYWETDSFDIIDEGTGRVKKSDIQRIKSSLANSSSQVIDSSKRQIHMQSGTELFNLPLAPSFQLTQQGIDQLRSKGTEVFGDGEGHIFIKSSQNQPLDVEIALSVQPTLIGITSRDTDTTLQMPSEIENQISQIKDSSASLLEKVTLWQDFVQGFFKYPSDDQVEQMYAQVDNSPSRLNAMAQGKLLDCYLAREFFMAGLKRLGLDSLEWRAARGHYVASKEKDGTSYLHSGNGHAWVKIRGIGEKSWIIFDPTPGGDPIHKGEGSMDEFGEFSPDLLSKEDMKSLQEEAQANEDERKKTTQESQDHYLMQFASQAGITPEEARKILSVLREADQMKDKQGRSILTRLKEQFDRIVEYYTQEKQEYFGLVEMSRGQELEDPVSASLDVRTGNLNPTGFSRRRIVEEKQEYYGGVDLEVVADGSGSMARSVDGVVKYLLQRDMGYLLHRALHRFSQDAQRRKLRLVTPLKIRSSQYIFRGPDESQNRKNPEVEEIKPLSDEFTPLQMAMLWKKSAENIGGGTPAHLGLQAVLDRIPPEEVQLLKEKKLLKVVALISDGDYDDAARVAELIKKAEDMNIIVAEFPITDRDSLEQLPQNVAEKFIEATKILMPERIKR